MSSEVHARYNTSCSFDVVDKELWNWRALFNLTLKSLFYICANTNERIKREKNVNILKHHLIDNSKLRFTR